MRESAPRRAWHSTETFRQSLLFFWGWEVIGASASAAVANWVLLPDKPSTRESVLYPVVGVIVGAIMAYGLVYLLNLALAPILQRNEARAALASLPGSPESPISPKVTVFVRVNDDDRSIPFATLGKAAKQLPDGNVLSIPVQLTATNDVLVEQMELEIVGKRAESSWESDWLSVGVPTLASVNFLVPDGVSSGEHEVKIVVYADGRWWVSNSFPIVIPPVQLSR